MSRWWLIPLACCASMVVGCSTVGGSAAGGGASSVADAPGTSAVRPELPSSDTPDTPDTPDDPGSSADESTPGGASVPVGTPAPSTTDGGDPPATTATSASAPTSATDGTAGGKVLSISRFQSPTRNIGCVIENGTSVRCDLGTSAITEKHDCQGVGVWGRAVSLTRGTSALMLCAGDTVRDPSAPVLAYGDSTRVGSILCSSHQDGMHCGDGAGHGFWLSRSSYEVA